MPPFRLFWTSLHSAQTSLLLRTLSLSQQDPLIAGSSFLTASLPVKDFNLSCYTAAVQAWRRDFLCLAKRTIMRRQSTGGWGAELIVK